MAPKVQRTTAGHLFGHLIMDGFLSYDYEYMNNRLEAAIVTRPYDKDFFRSFADQMTALPAIDNEHYSLVYHRLIVHCTMHNLSLPILSAYSAPGLLSIPHSIFSNGRNLERFPVLWCD
jgi:hypothetical protein